ncbi:MAG: hypothetical protein JO111_02405 [Caulobacteraceae bacterium]|nr:hypothetical protein [Caulobacteraceae bacterium]
MRSLVATPQAPLPVLRRERTRPVNISLWLPLTPLLLLLAPLVLLLAPFVALNRRARAVGPFRVVMALGALLTSLSGTCVEVDAPDARVRVRIF